MLKAVACSDVGVVSARLINNQISNDSDKPSIIIISSSNDSNKIIIKGYGPGWT